MTGEFYRKPQIVLGLTCDIYLCKNTEMEILILMSEFTLEKIVNFEMDFSRRKFVIRKV